jgi:EmrB/QacA subfamily drug resistance transporter
MKRIGAQVPYRYLVAAVFVVALFADVLDSTIVNVALPTLGRELHVGNDTLEWVVTGYLLSLAVWIPASGWIGDRFGTKRTFLFALALFLCGSALCGAAWSAMSLIAFRVLQGVGGGMLIPVGTAMVVRAFPPSERARGSAIIAVPAVIAPVVGPLLGGWLVDGAGWRWIFYVNLPIGLLGLIFAVWVLREQREERPGPFDVFGFALAGLSLVLPLYALSRVPAEGWAAPTVLGYLAAGAAAALALIYVERHRQQPMLDLELFSDRVFATSNATLVLTTAGLVGTLFLVPLYLQQLRGLSAFESGLTSFPQALGLVCVMPIAGRLYPRYGARPLVAIGLAATAITAALLIPVDLRTDLWWIRCVLYLRGLAFGLALLPLQTVTFANVSLSATGRASALFNAGRQMASSLGVAVLASALALASGVDGFHIAFGMSAVLGLAACLTSLHLPRIGSTHTTISPRSGMTRIARIEIFTAELPFRLSFGHALATRRSSLNVFVAVTLEDGSVGYGEGVPRDYVTGETVEGAVTALAERYAPALLGRGVLRVEDVPELLAPIGQAVSRDQSAWCALELAILDAFGHHFGTSVSAWLGGAPSRRVRYDAIVPFGGPWGLAAIGLIVRAFGFRHVKVKVGHDLERDARGLAILRRVLGSHIDLRVDANCAWTVDQALTAIQRFAPFRLSSIEQPVAADDLAGLRRLTAATTECIIVDESLCSVPDALRLASSQACDAFNIRVSKCGGLLNSMRIARIARDNRLACVVGAQVGESGILSAAGRHLAAALPGVRFVEGSAGRLLLKHDLTDENVLPGWGGWARSFDGPGLGVTVRPEVLTRYGRSRAVLRAPVRAVEVAA